MNNTYKQQLKIPASYVDQNLNMRFDSILALFQDMATFHSKEMGVSYNDLINSSNAIWVITKIALQVDKFPVSFENCEAETYPTDISGFRFLRELKITGDKGGSVLGHSEWCVLDATTKTLRRSNSIVYPFDVERRTDNVGLTFTKEQISVSESDYVYTYTVELTDIDCNKHTNNVSYAKMALNVFMAEELETFTKLEIKFVNQTYLKDEVKIYKKVLDDKVYIEGKLLDKTVFSILFSK